MLVYFMDSKILLQRYNTLLSNIDNIKKLYNANQDVSIIAVTKYSDIQTTNTFACLGLDVAMGESRAQSLRDKASVIEDCCWHFIGRLQKNEIKYIVEYASLIHSVDSIDIISAIDKEAKKRDKVQEILAQINISGESQKGGLDISQVGEFLDKASECENIKIVGLMGMAEYTSDEAVIERQFAFLQEKKYCLANEYKNIKFKELSMGMSGDYHLAIKHGSTMIRVGSFLFDE